MPVFSAVYTPGIENWWTDFNQSSTSLDQGEWSLYLDVFIKICLRWGTLDMDLLASLLNKVSRFVARVTDPMTECDRHSSCTMELLPTPFALSSFSLFQCAA